MQWTWDPEKDRENRIKHGIGFNTARLVFQDPLFTSREDPYPDEQRWRTIGLVGPSVIVVVHTWPVEGPGRIISARRANRTERRRYEEEHG